MSDVIEMLTRVGHSSSLFVAVLVGINHKFGFIKYSVAIYPKFYLDTPSPSHSNTVCSHYSHMLDPEYIGHLKVYIPAYGEFWKKIILPLMVNTVHTCPQTTFRVVLSWNHDVSFVGWSSCDREMTLRSKSGLHQNLKNAITIRVSKMTSHCVGTVQMKEEPGSGIRKWGDMCFKTTAENGEGAAVKCNGRLFDRQAAATGNTLLPTVDRRVRWASGVQNVHNISAVLLVPSMS